MFSLFFWSNVLLTGVVQKYLYLSSPKGGQVPLCNASPWWPAQRYLGTFPGWNEEGPLVRQQRGCFGEDAAHTCPLDPRWIRFLTYLHGKLWMQQYKCAYNVSLSHFILQRRDSSWLWTLVDQSLKFFRWKWERAWGSGEEEWRWRRKPTRYLRSYSLGKERRWVGESRGICQHAGLAQFSPSSSLPSFSPL